MHQQVAPRQAQRADVAQPVMRDYAPHATVRQYAPHATVRQYAPHSTVRDYAPHSTVRQYAPHATVRQYAPREAQPRFETRANVHQGFAQPRLAPRERAQFMQPRNEVTQRFAQRQRFGERQSFAERAPFVERQRFAEPQRIAQPGRFERRSGFVQYYSPSYFSSEPRREVVFQHYVPERIFIPPVSYIYGGYMPVYYNQPIPLPLPIAWSPVTYYGNGDNDGDENYGYNGFGNPYFDPYAGYYGNPYVAAQYPFATQVPYGNPYGYGGYGPYGVNAFGNAELQGVVISNTGGSLLVLTPNLQPVFVNTSIAEQNGYVNGSIAPGTFVYVFGYNTGGEFLATALS